MLKNKTLKKIALNDLLSFIDNINKNNVNRNNMIGIRLKSLNKKVYHFIIILLLMN